MAQTPRAITAPELHRQLATGGAATLLDVRTPPEHADAHVPGVRLVPLDELDAETFLREHGHDGKPIYVLCQSGGRARRAIEKFQRAGFEGCILVEGGTQAWISAGLPVNRGKSNVLPLMRQVQLVVGLVSAAGAALALTVSVWFAVLPLVTGFGLFTAGATGYCGLAMVLAKMPWNRSAACACSAKE